MALKGWSYSSLSTFDNCPLQFYKTRVSKEVVDLGSEATREGTRVHKALELRVRDGIELPPDMVAYESIADALYNFDGKVYTEIPFAVDQNLEPVEVPVVDDMPQWGNDSWCKCITDVLVVKGHNAAAFDWKTGKVRADSKQLMLNAALIFKAMPEVQTIKTSFVWLKYNQTTDDIFKRDDEKFIWATFLPRVQRLERAYEQDKWIPKPSHLCGWCPCTKKDCQFAKKQEK